MPEHPITTVAKVNEFKKRIRDIPEKVINDHHRGRGPETEAKFEDNQETGSQLLIWPIDLPFQIEINSKLTLYCFYFLRIFSEFHTDFLLKI